MRGLLWLAAMSLRPAHAFPQPYAHYTYDSWDAIARVWRDASGNGFHSNTATGAITMIGPYAQPNYLSGGPSDSICLSDSKIIAATFTICSLTKYTNEHVNRERIIQGRDDTDWFHGQWGYSANGPAAGVAYYQGSTTGDAANNDDVCRGTGNLVTWHQDRKCHTLEASTMDEMCRRMMVISADDMSPDVAPHGARETVTSALSDTPEDHPDYTRRLRGSN